MRSRTQSKMVMDGVPSSPFVLVHENGFEAIPEKAGMYDPDNERDACGVGFIVNIKGKPSHATVSDALLMLTHMEHRGATGEEENTGASMELQCVTATSTSRRRKR